MRNATLLLVLLGFAQQPAFKSGVELVRIPVSVMRSGEPVRDGLTAVDFTLTEDGVAQSIEVFERETLPVSLCIVVDASGSMDNGAIDFATAAVRAISSELREADQVAVISFAETPQLIVPWGPPAAAARLTLAAAGGTSLNDAAQAAFNLLESARNPRPVILLITDGFDTSSSLSMSQVVKTRRQSEAIVYAFDAALDLSAVRVDEFADVMRTPGTVPPSTNALRSNAAVSSIPALVGESGGTTYPLANAGDPRRFARRLVDELRYQYTLGYTPARAFDGKYRRVKVEIKKRGFQIRHRGGYLALPSKP